MGYPVYKFGYTYRRKLCVKGSVKLQIGSRDHDHAHFRIAQKYFLRNVKGMI